MLAVIFDIDGTLVDSNDEHAYAYVEAFYQFGYDVSFQEVRPLIGMGGDKLVPSLIGRVTKKKQKAIDELKGKVFKARYVGNLKAYPGVRELFQNLRKKKILIAIATSASESDKKLLLKIAKVDDLVDVSTSADDADNSKPDPDIIDAVLAKLGISLKEVIMVGDTPYDLLAARRAGIQSVAVRTGNWPDSELRLAGRIVNQVRDF